MNLTRNLSALVLFSLTYGQVNAAPVATAEATIDWATFSVTGYAMGVGSGPQVSWSDQSTSIDSSVGFIINDDYQGGSSDDWGTSLTTSVGNTATWSQAQASLSTLHTIASDAGLSWETSSYASAYRSGQFVVSGNGILVISVDYSLDVALESGDDFGGNFAGAYLDMRSERINSNINFSQSVYDSISLYDWYNWQGNNGSFSGHDQHVGTMNLALVVKDGEQYQFSISSSVDAGVSSVPLPTAAWLFLSGMMGFLGFTRRKSMSID